MSQEGRLGTQLVGSSGRDKSLVVKSQKYLVFSAVGRADGGNVPRFAPGSSLPSAEVSLALDVNGPCGVLSPGLP